MKPADSIKDPLILGLLQVISDNKGTDSLVFNCGPNYFVDNIIICTGTSSRHVDGISEKIVTHMKREVGKVPAFVDNKDSSWVVVDVGDAIVHIFTEEKRQHYDLEKLMEEIDIKSRKK